MKLFNPKFVPQGTPTVGGHIGRIGSIPASTSSAWHSGINSSGQAVNSGSLLSGLARESRVRPDTGTADGDRGVSDLQRANLAQAQAEAGRGMESQNAQQQQAQESARQQSLENEMRISQQAFQNKVQNANNQQSMLDAMKSHKDRMWWNKRNFLMGLIT